MKEAAETHRFSLLTAILDGIFRYRINNRIFLLYVFACGPICACVNHSRSVHIEYDTQPTYELETVEQVELSELVNYETEFVVEMDQLREIEQRISLFYGHYLGVIPESQKTAQGKTLIEGRSKNYKFTIERAVTLQGYKYSVNCISLQNDLNTETAARNAKVFARFLREGLINEELMSR